MAGAGRNFLFGTGIRKWMWNSSRFNRYGLHRDDVLYEFPEVKEALRRLPQDLLDERNFRLIRAMQLSCQKIVLPEEQWIKYEDDNRYLQPYIDEVKREWKEKEEWNKE